MHRRSDSYSYWPLLKHNHQTILVVTKFTGKKMVSIHIMNYILVTNLTVFVWWHLVSLAFCWIGCSSSFCHPSRHSAQWEEDGLVYSVSLCQRKGKCSHSSASLSDDIPGENFRSVNGSNAERVTSIGIRGHLAPLHKQGTPAIPFIALCRHPSAHTATDYTTPSPLLMNRFLLANTDTS